jgi:muramoyltetrapeptide carboxypeptidase
MAMTAPARTGMTKFRPVGPGSRVGLVAPASPFAREGFDAGVKELERLGFVPVFDDRVFARESIVAGPAALRAAALQECFERADIDAVLTVRGGYGSAEVLPLLDAAAIRASRKAFIGYSDVTAIHTFLTCHAGLASVHGPMIDGRLAVGEPAYDARSFLAAVSAEPMGALEPEGLTVVRAGEATGPLYGGTLSQLCASLGTPFSFDPPAECLLLIDEVGERPYRIRRMLTQLAQSGILARAIGVVIGQLPRCDEPGGNVTGLSVFADFLRDFRGPVVAGFPTGHSIAPLISVPLGVPARLVGSRRAALVFDDAAAT